MEADTDADAEALYPNFTNKVHRIDKYITLHTPALPHIM